MLDIFFLTHVPCAIVQYKKGGGVACVCGEKRTQKELYRKNKCYKSIARLEKGKQMPQ